MVDFDEGSLAKARRKLSPGRRASDNNAADASGWLQALTEELRRVWADPFFAPITLVGGLLGIGAIAGQISTWFAVMALLVFTIVFRWHRLASDQAARNESAYAQAIASENTEDDGDHRTGADPSWRTIVDCLSDPALVLDQDAFVVHYNPLMADLFPRVKLGQPVTSLTRSPELLAALEAKSGDLHRKIVHLEDRVPVHRSLTAFVSFISDEANDAPARSLIVLRDLTDQQKHAQLRADFISHASHELRTPLASMKSMVETLQGPARNDAAAREKFLAMMQVQASRMSRLIDDLLTLSRAEMRVHLAPTGEVDLNELILWVVEALSPMALSHETEVHVRTLEGQANVRGDRDDLVQVFQNLLQNAIKYGKDGGEIRVELQRHAAVGDRPERISVAIRDDGPGIPAEHIPRLTERFYRVSATASREKGGTGLGLAIVKHIVNRHRGELRISSELGKGSEFTVFLNTSTRSTQRSQPAPSQKH